MRRRIGLRARMLLLVLPATLLLASAAGSVLFLSAATELESAARRELDAVGYEIGRAHV